MRQRHDDDDSPYDRNGLLKDGRTAHVRFRDAIRARDQGDDDDDDGRYAHKVTTYDPMGRLVATYEHDGMRADPNRVYDSSGAMVAARPGFIGTADSQRIRDEAYQQSKRELSDAWKADAPPVGAYPLSSGEGSACTVNGAPGTLVRATSNWLVCKPTASDAKPHNPQQPISIADAQKIRDAAYQQSVDEMQNAWKMP